ncbi:MFS transporter [Burkholderiaceae bacterium FT117]|uniref:MFS transporter n=1 Tax=Zeimonas sediminis TaxID=2944268 RepID=UPI0023432466|nr:MFS transporter [Zeimonas sediminis]MCM5570128.1 MFS transporter [Zeimonas sediminis]
MRAGPLVASMCAGQLGSLLPHMAFSALIPRFAELWGLSATESGAIAGAYFMGYAVMVPLSTTLTDRVDARRILVSGTLLSTVATLAFAMFAQGFWSAAFLWAIAGAGFAGAYMPGLRALTDRLPPGDASRSITLYTSSYSVGVGLSFLGAQLVERQFGWQAAFVAVGCGPLVMTAVALSLPAHRPTPRAGARLLDFRPVLANRPALGFVLGYGAHCFELAAIRAWIVSFWLFTAAREGAPAWIDAVVVSVAVTLIAMPASILGNEMALRIGRRRLIAAVMAASAAFAVGLGLASAGPWLLVLALLLLHGCAVPADSGALTAGMVGAADPDYRGATMALHSTVGFAASFVGPLAVGLALDAFGGPASATGWQAAYFVLALAAAAGLPAIRLGKARAASAASAPAQTR